MLGDSLRRRQPQRRPRRKPSDPGAGGGGGLRRWRPLFIALPLAIVVPFAVGYLLAVYVIFPPQPASAAGVSVPDLVGRSAIEARAELAAIGLGDLDVSELPHPSATEGLVVAQSPLPGQQLRPGAGVRVAISAGRPRALVPDVFGFTAERAELLLRRAGFNVTAVEQEDPLPAGRVIRAEPAPGQELVLPAVVTLVISTGPPAAEPDTIPGDPLPPDGAGGALPGGW